MFILQFAMFDWFAKNITHRIFISPGNAPRVVRPHSARGVSTAGGRHATFRTAWTRGAMPTRLNNLETLHSVARQGRQRAFIGSITPPGQVMFSGRLPVAVGHRQSAITPPGQFNVFSKCHWAMRTRSNSLSHPILRHDSLIACVCKTPKPLGCSKGFCLFCFG
ncbi:hypothetical protein LF1_37500 [Rubripirellula obstinata]|uniref:Uncharacterized protein n=1 Tax=Rubripirellula obstinata TaxID=406547 RepID=A0A5B1CPK1_9BACT|nr:hypothetical protein LF1_37500 [Rubripirellula obstinata]